MKERPIIMRAEEVRAILDGRKTQARRLIKCQPPHHPQGRWSYIACSTDAKERDTFCYSWPDPQGCSYTVRGRETFVTVRPPCATGDRLWVRETFAQQYNHDDADIYVYRADMDFPPPGYSKWYPSVHMSRSESRITLEVTGVRVERLQDISETDAIAEGLKTLSKDGGRTLKTGLPDKDGLPDGHGWPWREWEQDPRRAYKRLWESTHAPDSWAQNPWVWAIEFRRVEP